MMGRYRQFFHTLSCVSRMATRTVPGRDREKRRERRGGDEERKRSGHDFKFAHPMHEILLEVVFCCCVPPVPFAMHVWKAPDPTRSSPGVLSGGGRERRMDLSKSEIRERMRRNGGESRDQRTLDTYSLLILDSCHGAHPGEEQHNLR